MIAEILTYKKITENMHTMIQESPIKTKHIIKLSGIPEATFYRKLRLNDFLPDEILRILQIIKPEEYEYEMIMNDIKEAEKDIAEGRVIDKKDFFIDINERIKK